ncbi:acetyl-CoA carboxylase biotin carboxyl carrier protein [Listeria costaricensis]|uniref:acetyl-CoA carboxylase biotin carboxyl carrier protein n=1 Tax=Listeria costaricensis TaxID=2026604 RepID=UPI000C0897EB|nr:acetyl-CoA carboxylase biotin carboxyl carrier protein [Listeria costaricensis]
MLSLEEIKQLIELVDSSNLDEFDLEYEGQKIHLKKNSGAVAYAPVEVAAQAPVIKEAVQQAPAENAQQAATEQPEEALEVITSPMVGTFYASAAPEDDAFVSVGSQVSATTVVCIVEAMKLFNEITADITGEIKEVLVTNGELVEFGQPLFKVKKK